MSVIRMCSNAGVSGSSLFEYYIIFIFLYCETNILYHMSDVIESVHFFDAVTSRNLQLIDKIWHLILTTRQPESILDMLSFSCHVQQSETPAVE